MPHASAIAPADNCTPSIASVSQLDRRPWPVRIRTAAADTDLTAVSRCFAITLATFFDRNGRWSLSPEQISEATGHGRAQVFEHLARCRKAGLITVTSGHAVRRSTYSAGPAIASMPPAEPTRSAVRDSDKPVRDSGPLSITGSDSGSHTRTTERSTTSGTQPTEKRHDPRDDDRYECQTCGRTWSTRFGRFCTACGRETVQLPRRAEPEGRRLNTKPESPLKALHTCASCGRQWGQAHGPRCHGCGGTAQAEIAKAEAAEARHDARQAERLQAEVDNQPVPCTRCGYDRAKRADLADIGRCTHCMKLTDAEAADLAQKGKRLHARMVKAWNDRDHVRGKALAQELTELYADCLPQSRA